MAAGRKEDFKQATVYLCNNSIRFTKMFYPSGRIKPWLKPCQNEANFLEICNKGENYKAKDANKTPS